MSGLLTIIKLPLDAWNAFFHRQSELSIFGFIRIAYAVLLLINILSWWPDLNKWFGEDGVLTLAVSRMVVDPDTLTIFQWLPTTPTVLWTCYLILIINVVCLMAGLFTRLQCVCVFVLFTSFAHRNSLIFDGEDILFRLMAFYLFFSPAGKYWSVDNWLASRRTSEPAQQRFAIWPLRLIQIQTCCVMLFSGIEKCQGAAWREGTALYYVSRLDDLFYRFPVPEFIFESLFLVAIATWAAMLMELSIPVLVWFSKTRRIALCLAVLFHLSLEYMMNLNLFQWLMLVGWSSFIEQRDAEAK